MLEIHELLGRDLDPIDDVRRQFERSYTEDYYNPLSGDRISDDYYRIIDLSTQPGELLDSEAGKLNRSITQLNSKYPYIEKRLGESSLFTAYNQVAEQVNDINAAEHHRFGIQEMQAAPLGAEVTSR
jgi:hypothetical protein